MKKVLVSVGFVCALDCAQAGLGENMAAFFNAMGAKSVYSPAHAYEDQRAGYYSFGSMFVQTPNEQFSFIHYTPAKLDVDECGNIKISGGSFSIMKKGELISIIKKVPAEAFFGAIIALKSFGPILESATSGIMSMLRQVNLFTMNRCSIRQAFAKGYADIAKHMKYRSLARKAHAAGEDYLEREQ